MGAFLLFLRRQPHESSHYTFSRGWPFIRAWTVQLSSYNLVWRYDWQLLGFKHLSKDTVRIVASYHATKLQASIRPLEQTAYMYSLYLHSWFCISCLVEPRRARYILKSFWRHKVQRANLGVKLYACLVSLWETRKISLETDPQDV